MSELAFAGKGVAEQARGLMQDFFTGKSPIIPSFSNVLHFFSLDQVRRKD
jgi:hypothetical protein